MPLGRCFVDPGRSECVAVNSQQAQASSPWLHHLQDTVGAASWLETQCTHAPAVAGLLAAFPEHYESWAGGHMAAEQVGGRTHE